MSVWESLDAYRVRAAVVGSRQLEGPENVSSKCGTTPRLHIKNGARSCHAVTKDHKK